MSLATIPPGGLSLHGFAAEDDDTKHTSEPAILFKLNADLLEDVKTSAKAQGSLQLLTGSTPKIRLGSRTIDLTLSNEAFRHELYCASTESLSAFNFAGVLGHRAELKVPERKQSLGSDAALATLQDTLASYKQTKEAKSVNISDQVVKEPKNRWEAAKDQKNARRRGVVGMHTHSSPSGSSSAHQSGVSATSVPASGSAERSKAMRTPLIHLLAMRPLSRDEIVQKTKIPKEEVDDILQKIGSQEGGDWKLVNRAYKELDVWKFGYSTQEDRQAAIDNAIRAYDRLRLGKDEKLWQMLLPKEDRDKGIVLSRLHLGTGAGSSFLTPNPAGSGDEADAKSAAGTPRLGPSSTPKIGSGKGDSAALSKRLFSKDPKKARAADEAKEKKRKEREAAAAVKSDTEGGKQPARKKQTTKVNNPKVKSEEIVRDSSEESEEGQVSRTGAGSSSQPKSTTNERKNESPANATAKATTIARSTPKQKESPNAPAKTRPKATAGATPKPVGTPSARPLSAAASKTSKPAALGGKSTPNGLSAPSSQNRPQLSPQKGGSRPTVPSPLGAARPRIASDVSDRGAVGIQRVRQGGETPKGLGITNGVRKRHDTVTSVESNASRRPDKMNGDHPTTARKTTTNGTSVKAPTTNGTGHRDERGIKRKAVDSPARSQEEGPTIKHRKTESTSSQSQKSQASSVGAGSSTDLRLQRSNSSDSTSSLLHDITYNQGVEEARRFRDILYPQYAAEYDKQHAMEMRGEKVSRQDRERLWGMHRRIEQMKREMKIASEREHFDES